MARPTIVSITTGGDMSSNSTTSISFAKPSDLADGDLLVMVYCVVGSGAPATAPDGDWVNEAGNSNRSYIWSKIVTDAASEPDTITFTHGASGDSGVMYQIRGYDPVYWKRIAASSNNIGFSSPGRTQIATECLVLAGGAAGSSNTGTNHVMPSMAADGWTDDLIVDGFGSNRSSYHGHKFQDAVTMNTFLNLDAAWQAIGGATNGNNSGYLAIVAPQVPVPTSIDRAHNIVGRSGVATQKVRVAGDNLGLFYADLTAKIGAGGTDFVYVGVSLVDTDLVEFTFHVSPTATLGPQDFAVYWHGSLIYSFPNGVLVVTKGDLVHADNFDRGTGALGSTDGNGALDPLAWTTSSGDWKVQAPGSQFDASTNVGARDGSVSDGTRQTALFDPGQSDMAVAALVVYGTARTGGLSFRYQDADNAWRLVDDDVSSIRTRLVRRVAGTDTEMQNTGVSPNGARALCADCSGSTIRTYICGSPGYAQITAPETQAGAQGGQWAAIGVDADSTFQTNTKWGLVSSPPSIFSGAAPRPNFDAFRLFGVANHRPTANSLDITCFRGVGINIALSASDPDGDPIVYWIDSLPADGTLTDPADGDAVISSAPYALAGTRVRYTSDADAPGGDGFRYYVEDDGGITGVVEQSNIASVDLDIVDPPPESGASFSLLVNFADPLDLAAANWVDQTDRIRKPLGDITRGRMRELTQFDPGQVRLDLDNLDAALFPTNSDSPYYPDVVPMRGVMLQASYIDADEMLQTETLYTGFADTMNPRWQYGTDAWVEWDCYDLFRVLSGIKLPSSAYALLVDTAGPHFWYRCSEDAGTRMLDSGPLKAHGEWVGGPTFNARQGLVANDSDGAIGLNIDSSAGQLGKVRNEAVRITNTPFAVECIIQPRDGITDGLYDVVRQPSRDLFTFEWGIALEVSFGVARIKAWHGTTGRETDLGTLPLDGQPHYVAIRRTGAALQIVIDTTVRSTSSFSPLLNLSNQDLLVGTPFLPGVELYQGIVDEIAGYDYDPGLSTLQAHGAAMQHPWAGDTSGERIARILEWAGIPEALLDLDVGDSVLGDADLASKTVLTYLQEIATAEDAGLYVTATGILRFRARSTLQTPTHLNVVASFTDQDDGVYIYQDGQPEYGTTELRNKVRLRRAGGQWQEVVNATSIERFGQIDFEKDNLPVADDERVLELAGHYVAKYGEPAFVLREVELDVSNYPQLIPIVLALELERRIALTAHIPGMGAAFTQESLIQKITHRIGQDGTSWRVRYTVSPVDAVPFLVLDDATLGTLDENRLGA